jgi:hypothetical protein
MASRSLGFKLSCIFIGFLQDPKISDFVAAKYVRRACGALPVGKLHFFFFFFLC